MRWWVYEYYSNGLYAELLSQVFWVLLSITLHELAHGWAAIWQGDNTPISYQRMTLNPMVHMGGYSLIMFIVCGITWGVMPVDPSRFRWRRRGRIVVAGAGPAMNLIIAFVCLTGAALWLNYGPITNDTLYRNVLVFLDTGGRLNVFLALFNLLPIPPLDGSDILSGMSFTCYRWFQNPQAQQIGFFILLVIFISDIGWLIHAAAAAVSNEYIVALMRILPGGP